MSEKEQLYQEIKTRAIYLLHKKLLSQSQCDHLLNKARLELGLLVVNKSIYL